MSAVRVKRMCTYVHILCQFNASLVLPEPSSPRGHRPHTHKAVHTQCTLRSADSPRWPHAQTRDQAHTNTARGPGVVTLTHTDTSTISRHVHIHHTTHVYLPYAPREYASVKTVYLCFCIRSNTLGDSRSSTVCFLVGLFSSLYLEAGDLSGSASVAPGPLAAGVNSPGSNRMSPPGT